MPWRRPDRCCDLHQHRAPRSAVHLTGQRGRSIVARPAKGKSESSSRNCQTCFVRLECWRNLDDGRRRNRRSQMLNRGQVKKQADSRLVSARPTRRTRGQKTETRLRIETAGGGLSPAGCPPMRERRTCELSWTRLLPSPSSADCSYSLRLCRLPGRVRLLLRRLGLRLWLCAWF